MFKSNVKPKQTNKTDINASFTTLITENYSNQSQNDNIYYFIIVIIWKFLSYLSYEFVCMVAKTSGGESAEDICDIAVI